MSETWHDSGVTDLYDAQDELGNAWARDRRAVIDEMAREVCPTQWREGGHMRYKGHTITWGEYVMRRHEVEDEEKFTVETWREREFNPVTSSLTDYQARGAAIDTGLCSDGYPCGESVAFGERYCDDCPNYVEDSDSESALSQALSMPSKYHVRLKGAWCDVYDVLLAFGVTNPADQHAIKKMLRPGKRGHKDGIQDRREAIQSLHRAIELEGGA